MCLYVHVAVTYMTYRIVYGVMNRHQMTNEQGLNISADLILNEPGIHAFASSMQLHVHAYS